jgi:hypothetical protein
MTSEARTQVVRCLSPSTIVFLSGEACRVIQANTGLMAPTGISTLVNLSFAVRHLRQLRGYEIQLMPSKGPSTLMRLWRCRMSPNAAFMRPPSAKLCHHPVQRNAAAVDDEQRVYKVSSTPEAYGAAVPVRSGRSPARTQESKVRFADKPPGRHKTPCPGSMSALACWHPSTLSAAALVNTCDLSVLIWSSLKTT